MIEYQKGVLKKHTQQEAEQEKFFAALEKHKLKYGFLAAGSDSHFGKHLDQFQRAV